MSLGWLAYRFCIIIYIQVVYVMLDGAPINRKVVKSVEAMFGCHSSSNPDAVGESITYIMDPKVYLI